ncbi:hypothetical protein [Paraburkholderia sp. GAS42]|jgi:hypothetical protein|uniref:hypothetical protein n=1 Tax=Paraburkholderia sp. GAS42 TaxID=3035135 RepID=UPI003D20DA2E
MGQPPLSSIHTRKSGTWEHVQKLTLCRQLLQQCCDEYRERHSVRVEIDDRQFTTAFFAWLDVVARNASYRNTNAPDYFQFAFGVLLRDLLRDKAVHVTADSSPHPQPAADDIAGWWPVGYLLTWFCIGTLKHVMREECALEVQPADALSQRDVWQSFRENIVEEPSLAIAFFDRFMGLEPNWREPGQVLNRPGAVSISKPA